MRPLVLVFVALLTFVIPAFAQGEPHSDLATADEWVQKAIVARKANEQQKERQAQQPAIR